MTTPEYPNVVLVTIDSLRADHCGCYGYERDTTPTLDGMADRGVKFERAIAPGPATPESMPAIFTGEWPADGGRHEDGELTGQRERIRSHMRARHTLPQRMQDLGYQTAAFTPNPFTSRHFGFDDGFDHFQDFMDESNRGSLYDTVFQGFLDGSGVSSLARVFMNFWQREEVFKPWESYYDNVLEWANGTAKPYFLWVFLMDVHNPYMSSSEYRTQSRLAEFHANFEFWRQGHETPFSESVHDRLVTAYDDSVRYADAFLERLQTNLSDDDPVIVVHGDHGEAFGEHGSYGHEPYLHDENVRVPLVVSNTDVEQREIQSETPISLASMPDLVTSIATSMDVHTDPKRYTVSKTEKGGRRAVYTADFEHIAPDTAGDRPLRNGDGTAVYRRILERSRMSETERIRIARSAESVATEDRI